MDLYVIDPLDQGLIKRIDILTVAPRPSEAMKLSENWLRSWYQSHSGYKCKVD